MKYISIIGLEIHAQLKTESKMFCECPNKSREQEPNTNVCSICLGHPGMLPVPNRQAIEWTMQSGLACGCTIATTSKFDRKHYFYPDLPKGYQISQYDEPFCENGSIQAEGEQVSIVRIHLEEDTGKLTHEGSATFVDCNRAGIPLMELVTGATIKSAQQAKAFCQNYQHILRTIGVADANMELGEMRCEANVSVQKEGTFRYTETGIEPIGDAVLYNKVEVKNINSFKSVEKAIEYELERQKDAIEAGEEIHQETRGWDDNKQITVSQRAKESAHDYRYFPEPDIPPITKTPEQIQELGAKLPELPADKKERFVRQYKCNEADAVALTANHHVANFYEEVITEASEWIQALKENSEEVTDKEALVITKSAANWIQGELFKLLKETETEIQNMKLTAENFAELMVMLKDQKVNSSAAQTILEEMLKTGGDPSNIAEEKNLQQESNENAVEEIVKAVLKEHKEAADDLRNGNERAIKFLMGMVMKESKGKANPQMATDLIKKNI